MHYIYYHIIYSSQMFSPKCHKKHCWIFSLNVKFLSFYLNGYNCTSLSPYMTLPHYSYVSNIMSYFIFPYQYLNYSLLRGKKQQKTILLPQIQLPYFYHLLPSMHKQIQCLDMWYRKKKKRLGKVNVNHKPKGYIFVL